MISEPGVQARDTIPSEPIKVFSDRMVGPLVRNGLYSLRRDGGVDRDALLLQPLGDQEIVVGRYRPRGPSGRVDLPWGRSHQHRLPRKFVVGEDSEPGWCSAQSYHGICQDRFDGVRPTVPDFCGIPNRTVRQEALTDKWLTAGQTARSPSMPRRCPLSVGEAGRQRRAQNGLLIACGNEA
jgi:hypothetical protein